MLKVFNNKEKQKGGATGLQLTNNDRMEHKKEGAQG